MHSFDLNNHKKQLIYVLYINPRRLLTIEINEFTLDQTLGISTTTYGRISVSGGASLSALSSGLISACPLPIRLLPKNIKSYS